MATTPRDGKLQEKTETLDDDCLRSLGHPHDHAVRQELLSALEGDESLHPRHAGLAPSGRPEQGLEHSADVAGGIASGTSNRDMETRSLCHAIQRVCRGLADRVQVLAAYRGKRGSDRGSPRA